MPTVLINTAQFKPRALLLIMARVTLLACMLVSCHARAGADELAKQKIWEKSDHCGDNCTTSLDPKDQLQLASELTIEKVPNKTIGAVVTGIDLTNPEALDNKTLQVLKDALFEHAVLIFPGVDPSLKWSQAEQTKLSLNFGELAVEQHLSDGKRQDLGANLKSPEMQKLYYEKLRDGNLFWHTDGTFVKTRPSSGIMFSMSQPAEGGYTQFADTQAPYEDLDEATKERLTNLKAFHSAQFGQLRNVGWRAKPLGPEGYWGASGTAFLRPLVDTHVVTGRKSLVVGRHAFSIQGMPFEEGEDLLDSLVEHCAQKQYVLDIKWKAGDLIITDNRRTLHRMTPYNYSEPRNIRGVWLSGESPGDDGVELPNSIEELSKAMDFIESRAQCRPDYVDVAED